MSERTVIRFAAGAVDVRCAGSAPGEQVNPVVAAEADVVVRSLDDVEGVVRDIEQRVVDLLRRTLPA